jgi:hypothetical protein
LSFGGRLETLELSTLLQTLGVSSASGRLTLTRLESHAVLVFRGGRVVYVGGGTSEETLAGRLLRMGLVGQEQLMGALELQHDGTRFRRLGDVLAEMMELVGELLRWTTGFFRFVPSAPGVTSDVEVAIGDFVLPDGIAPLELLMHATAVMESEDQASPPGAPAPVEPPPVARQEESLTAPRDATAKTRGPRLSESGSYTADFSGEVVLLLLRFASQVLNRAVVFVLEGEAVRGVGEFGLQISGRNPAEVVGETLISLRDPSILRTAVTSRRPYVGPLEPTRLNLKLIKRLGGVLPREAMALPLVVRNEVHLVLYGDNAAESRPIGPIDALEAAAARASRILERTLAARERGESDPRA